MLHKMKQTLTMGKMGCSTRPVRTPAAHLASPSKQMSAFSTQSIHRLQFLVRAQSDQTKFDVNEELDAEPKPSPADSIEADWDVEMSIFKQRTMRPNQLATLRELEAKVEVGKVIYYQENLAIVEGLDNDAPEGTKLAFVSGATGVLLWRRSDNLCFVTVVGGHDLVTVGEGVECKVAAVLQVVDEVEGPATKRDFELFKVPVGASLVGAVVDYLARPLDGSGPLGLEARLPLLNKQINMEDREPICESCSTGVKAFDTLAPLGRGQQMLVVGPSGSGKSTLVLDAVLGQKGAGVRCVYAAVNVSAAELEERVGVLRAQGALQYTTVVAALDTAPLGERFAALGTACSIAERVRDEGGASLVVLDDIKCAVELWEMLTKALADMGEARLSDGLIKDGEGRCVAVERPAEEEELVVYEGMLVSAAAAMRRSFFTSLLQRAAKAKRLHGGGAASLLAVVPGRPATGQSARLDLSKYKTLSPQQMEKIQAALEAKSQAAQAALLPGPSELRTELVEEFMSISDGQLVLERNVPATSSSSSSGPPIYTVSPQLSISRVGGRAYPKALETLAPQVRFELIQAADAARFSNDPSDPLAQQQAAAAARLKAAITQTPRQPVPLSHQVVTLHALKSGLLETVAADQVPSTLHSALQHVQLHSATALQEIEATRQFTAAAEKSITDSLQHFFASHTPQATS